MRRDRNKIEPALPIKRKTDSAKWKEATLKSLTYSQEVFRSLCVAFLTGEITSEEFKEELPSVFNARDREKRRANLGPQITPM